MEDFEEIDLQIADYFDNKMSAEEEASFMLALQNNIAWRERFEDEIALQALLGANGAVLSAAAKENILELESADAHIARINTVLSTAVVEPKEIVAEAGVANKKNPALVKTLPRGLYWAAAVLILVVSSAAIYYQFVLKTNNVKNGPFPKGPDVVKENRNKNPAIDTVLPAEKLFNQFASTYQKSDNDPPATSLYYEAYRNRHFQHVIDAKPEDIQNLGGTDDEAVSYLWMYKALSYQALGNDSLAIRYFDAIPDDKKQSVWLQSNIEWYKMLSLLRERRFPEAKIMAQSIAASKSPYQSKARLIIEAMSDAGGGNKK